MIKYKLGVSVAGGCMGCPSENTVEYFEAETKEALFERIEHINKNWASVTSVEQVPAILSEYYAWSKTRK